MATGWTGSDLPGEWYWQSGTGMGGVLNIVAETGAYALSDRASWCVGRKQQHQIAGKPF